MFNSLVIREMQIISTVTYYHIPIRITKEVTATPVLVRDREVTSDDSCIVGGNVKQYSTLENSLRISF